jgi:hypothetical protein
MSIATVGHRLAKVEDLLGQPAEGEECPFRGFTTILSYRQGEPVPPVPEDAAVCSLCGLPHVLFLEEVVVTSRDEAKKFLDEHPQDIIK